MAELKQLWENDRLEFHGSALTLQNYYTFKELLNTCYAKEWIPYCKKPFDGAESVIRYLENTPTGLLSATTVSKT